MRVGSHRGIVRLGHIHKFALPVQSAPPRHPTRRRGQSPPGSNRTPEQTWSSPNVVFRRQRSEDRRQKSRRQIPALAVQGSNANRRRPIADGPISSVGLPSSVVCFLSSGGERDRTDDLLLAKQAL